MSVSGIEAGLIDLLAVFLIAAGVGVFVAKIGQFPYTIALLIAGFLVGLVGLPLDIPLTHDIILLVLLPPLLFEGAATTDLDEFRENLGHILLLAIPGLLLSIVLLGFVAQTVLGFPLLIALLFATIALPTDPVSVLALFEELGVPERLATLVEGESLINDGIAVVLFSSLLALVNEGSTAGDLATFDALTTLGVGFLVSSIGGAIVGLAAGYSVYRVMSNLDEHMTEIILTFILAYGAFLVAEHYLHVSGVIATVVAGLFIGNQGADHAMSAQTKVSIFNTWETAAFVVNTFIFLVIGATTPISGFITHWKPLAISIVLVLGARALAVYPMSWLGNAVTNHKVSTDYQHVLLWGGLHGSIPIALVLGLPKTVPYQEQLRVLVFGIAAFSLVVQGLSMKRLLNGLGVTTRPPEQRLYEVLVGRARAVTAALDDAERLHEQNEIPTSVYEAFVREYEDEKNDLTQTIQSLLSEFPDVKTEQRLVSERRLLKREKSAILDAVHSGSITTAVSERLLAEIDLKLSQVNDGKSTLPDADDSVNEYEEFWRSDAEKLGISPDKDSQETPEE